MSWPWLLITGALLTSLTMFVMWRIQQRTRNAGTVDVAWSAGIGILVLYFAIFSSNGFLARRAMVAAMTGSWSIRLALHLWKRIGREPEDGRYEKIRTEKGIEASRWFFWFYQFQAALVVLFAIPPLIAMRVPFESLNAFDAVALAIWLISVIGEAIADRQLAAFRANPDHRGKTCREGLWRYSRHPNYFFEWLHWFVYVAIAIAAPLGWLTLAGPLLMLFFLFQMTGIPPTEARALVSRGDDYRDYQKTTSVFFPWFPKEASK
ncbi:MAG: DUF1295 domain-containing protein [Planctomycetes bacterium]|nr:DUF1295 domain-containing protein [Planctomycetota bacterium]